MSVNDNTQDPNQEPGLIEKVKQAVGLEANTGTPARSPVHKFERVHIIVNPSSGQNGPDLALLNKVLQELNIEWEMFITRYGGDAKERTQAAIAAGVDAIAVYGGDGTVLEVASSLAGSDVPLVLLPGGTANALSLELGIPRDLRQAALLLGGAPNAIRAIDMGALGEPEPGNPDKGAMLFFHLGIGAEGRLHEIADRDAKDRSGMFAYITAALKTVTNPTQAHYRLTLDGEAVEADGINCMITTYGSVGVAGLTVSHAIDMSDGILDVVVIQDANVPSLLSAAATAVTAGELAGPMQHWQAHEVTVVAEPEQPVAVDGELFDVKRVTARVVPQALKVVVPAPSG